MSLAGFVAQYGAAAIFIGAGVEGETLVVTGGVLASKNILSLWMVIVAAASGSFVADQLFFLAGRHYRDHRFVARLIARPAFERALAWLDRHPTGFILGFRFLYGLRTVSPVAVGTSHVSARTFMLLNALSATVWAALFSGLGYAFGARIATFATRYIAPEHLPLAVGALILALLAIAQGIRWLHRRPRAAQPI